LIQLYLSGNKKENLEEHMSKTEHFPLIVVSDLHISMKNAASDRLRRFFDSINSNAPGAISCDTLVCNGDVIDGQRRELHVQRGLPEDQKSILDSFNALGTRGVRRIVLPGNHDEKLRGMDVFDKPYHGIELKKTMDYTTEQGKRFLIFHGDQLDPDIRDLNLFTVPRWLIRPADSLYIDIVEASARIDVRLERSLKVRFNAFASFMDRIDTFNGKKLDYANMAMDYAHDRGYDGIITGHSHLPQIIQRQGLVSANSGDWTESFTALALTHAGSFELLRWHEYDKKLGPEPHDPRQKNKDTFRHITDQMVADIEKTWPGHDTPKETLEKIAQDMRDMWRTKKLNPHY
jgi:UDP-2,3-diacylglucosamine pyrophosphatase LpxH